MEPAILGSTTNQLNIKNSENQSETQNISLPFKNYNPQNELDSAPQSTKKTQSEFKPFSEAIGSLQYELPSSVLSRLPKDTSPESLMLWFAERKQRYPRLKPNKKPASLHELCDYSSDSDSEAMDDDDDGPKEMPINYLSPMSSLSTPHINAKDENQDILNNYYEHYLHQFGFHPMVIYLCQRYPPKTLPLPRLFYAEQPNLPSGKQGFKNNKNNTKKRVPMYLPSILSCTSFSNPFLSIIIATHAECGLNRQRQQCMLKQYRSTKDAPINHVDLFSNNNNNQTDDVVAEGDSGNQNDQNDDIEQIQQPGEQAQPSTEQEQPLTKQEQPSTEQEKPSIEQEQPSTEQEQSSTEQPTEQAQPPTEQAQPSTEQVQPLSAQNTSQTIENSQPQVEQFQQTKSSIKSKQPQVPEKFPYETQIKSSQQLLIEPLLNLSHFFASHIHTQGYHDNDLTTSAITKTFKKGMGIVTKQSPHYRKMQSNGQLHQIHYVDLYKKLLSNDLLHESKTLLQLLRCVIDAYDQQKNIIN